MSFSRISRSSSGAVPSTASSMPFLRNGFSTFLVTSSRARRPSRRARSANSTIVAMVASGASGLALSALEIMAPAPVASFMSPEAMAAPKVPPNTSSMAAGTIREPGWPPSMIIDPKMQNRAMPIPAMVPLSISGLGVFVADQAQDDRVLGLVELDHLGQRDDRGAGLLDALHHLVEAFG